MSKSKQKSFVYWLNFLEGFDPDYVVFMPKTFLPWKHWRICCSRSIFCCFKISAIADGHLGELNTTTKEGPETNNNMYHKNTLVKQELFGGLWRRESQKLIYDTLKVLYHWYLLILLKFRYSEKATKIWLFFHS